jgi:hypothetical protein
LEGGKLNELGYGKVTRICAAVGLVLDVRLPELEAPLMPHRHLTEAAGATSRKPRSRTSSFAGTLPRGAASSRLFGPVTRNGWPGESAKSFVHSIPRTPKHAPLRHCCRICCATLPRIVAKRSQTPEWEALLAHAALVQTKVPGAVLVGGTAAALHAHHREIEHIDAGLRNQNRSAPLETTTVPLPGGGHLEVPTVDEMLRIKTYLVVSRNATRDYLDVAALAHHLGLHKSVAALQRMNELYGEFAGEGGDIRTTVVVKLSTPDPYDLTDVDLGEYKGITAPWNDWRAVEKQCRALAVALLKSPPHESNPRCVT